MTTAELIEKYAAGPRQLRAAVAGFSREQAAARPIPGKWSTLEVVCHIADFEPVYADRMKRVLVEDRPTLLGADQEAFARRLAYPERDLEEELAIIDFTRRQMVRILRTVHAEDFQRVGIHSEYGERTLARLLETIANHIPHHVKFIEEKRKALGLPAA